MPDYFTIAGAGETQTRVKNSRFIAWITPVASREHAEDAIAQRCRIFADATHNCFAWRVGAGRQIAAHAGDAGEPAGTAGRPMLQALEARKVTNVAAVVTRYFGGVKLGTGGLRRAYSSAMFAVLDVVAPVPFFEACRWQLVYPYSDSAAVEKAMRKFAALPVAEHFEPEVRRRVVEIRTECEDDFYKVALDLTAGRIQLHRI